MTLYKNAMDNVRLKVVLDATEGVLVVTVMWLLLLVLGIEERVRRTNRRHRLRKGIVCTHSSEVQ